MKTSIQFATLQRLASRTAALTVCLFLLPPVTHGRSSQLQATDSFEFSSDDAAQFDNFGETLDLSGDTLIVGAPRKDFSVGAAYVFVASGSTWQQQTRLFGQNPQGLSVFGLSVVIDGNVAAVAGRGSSTGFGIVSIYERTGTVWTLQDEVSASDEAVGDGFGNSIDLDGSTLVVGAPFDNDNATSNSGSVYVYERTGTTWIERDKLTASAPFPDDQFGGSVALDGDRVVIGAPRSNAPEFAPTAYVFSRSGTEWSQEIRLLGDGQPNTLFGSCVSVYGDSVLIGAPDAADREGRVFSYRWTGAVWVEEATLAPSDVGSGRFGSSSSRDDDRVCISAPGADLSRGACYLFTRTGTSWRQELRHTVDSLAGLDLFGSAVALEGERLIASAPGQDNFGGNSGSAFSFRLFDSPHVSFCFGSNPSGCSPCPCANTAGPTSGGGCLNSSLSSAVLQAYGVASVSNDTLGLEVFGASPDTFAILSSAENQLPFTGPCPTGNGVLAPGVFDGLRCIGGDFRRHGTRTTDLGGASTSPWGFPNSNPPQGLLSASGFVAGQSRAFQAIYRDGSGSCATGRNTTNAIQVTILP